MVARLTPDQEVACSSHVGITHTNLNSIFRILIWQFLPAKLSEFLRAGFEPALLYKIWITPSTVHCFSKRIGYREVVVKQLGVVA